MRPPLLGPKARLLLPFALLSCLFFADSLHAQRRPGGFTPPPSPPPRPVNPPGGFNVGNPGGFNVGNQGGFNVGNPGGMNIGNPGGLNVGNPGGMNIGNPGMNIGNPGGMNIGRPGGMNIGNPGMGQPGGGVVFIQTWKCPTCNRELGRGNSPPASATCCGVNYTNGFSNGVRLSPFTPAGNNNNVPFGPSFSPPASSSGPSAADVSRGLKTMTIIFGVGLVAVGGLALAGTAFLVVFSLKASGSSRRRR